MNPTRWPLALIGSTVSNDDNNFPSIGIGHGGGCGNVNGRGHDNDNDGSCGNYNNNNGGINGDIDDGSKIDGGDREFYTCFNDREGSSKSLKVTIPKMNDKNYN